MIVNVCCSGSSGSTFLSYLFNRHPDLACGDELGLFSKPVVFNSFSYLKKKSFLIKNFGISSNPYFEDTSFLRNLSSYKLSNKIVWSWIKESRNICDLANKFNDHILGLTGKKIWVEKTPENIYLISHFINMFPNAKIVHMIRDPRDVILSIIKRGGSLEHAAEHWLVSVSAIANYRVHPNVLEIRYEDLILKKEQTLENICKHLSVDFNMDYFVNNKYQSKGLIKSDHWDSWNLSPNQEFSSEAIGRYKFSDINFNSIFSLKLTQEYAALLDVKEYTLINLAKSYQYSLPDMPLDGSGNKTVRCKKAYTIKKSLGRYLRDYLIENEKVLSKTVH